MFKNIKNNQPIFFSLMSKMINQNKINHAFLLDTSLIEDKEKYALSIAKLLLCQEEYYCDKCLVCQKINKKEHDELEMIKTDDSWIKKDQIIELQKKLSRKTYDKYKIYIIFQADKLNAHSANSILKLLEEGEQDLVGILVSDKPENIIETIKSRCLYIKFDQELIEKNIEQLDKEEFIKMVKEFEVIKRIDFEKLNEEFYIKNNQELESLIENLIIVYRDVLYDKLGFPTKLINWEKELKQISFEMTEEEIMTTINLLIEIKNNLKYNYNTKLLIDEFVFKVARRICENI